MFNPYFVWLGCVTPYGMSNISNVSKNEFKKVINERFSITGLF